MTLFKFLKITLALGFFFLVSGCGSGAGSSGPKKAEEQANPDKEVIAKLNQIDGELTKYEQQLKLYSACLAKKIQDECEDTKPIFQN